DDEQRPAPERDTRPPAEELIAHSAARARIERLVLERIPEPGCDEAVGWAADRQQADVRTLGAIEIGRGRALEGAHRGGAEPCLDDDATQLRVDQHEEPAE